MDFTTLASAMTLLIALIISIAIHEAAHAFAAHWQGDRTPEIDGRLTLNPIPHLAPFGIILPVALHLLGINFLLGWGKPVAVNPARMKSKKWGHVMVAAAGPAANLVLCFMSVVVYIVYHMYFNTLIPEGHFLYPFVLLLHMMIFLNAILAVFNLLPFPPLDGGTVLPAFLPPPAREFFEDYIAPYGFFIFLALFISGGISWIGEIANGYVRLSQFVVQSILGT